MSKYDAETKTWHGPQIPYKYPMDVMVGDLILESLTNSPDRIVHICADDDSTLTCSQLRIRSIRVAQHLQKIGIQEDDIVGLVTHHSHFATCFITGCILIGAIVSPLDGRMSEDDIRHVYGQSMPKIIVSDNDAIPKLQNAFKNVDSDYRPCLPTEAKSTSLNLKMKTFLKATGDEENFKVPKFSKPSDQKILAILCSSATTGTPKSVCITHTAAMEALTKQSMLSVAESATITKSILFSPLSWVTGFITHLKVSFSQSDIRIWTARKFSVETFIEIVEKYRITNVFLAPYMLNTLLNSQKFLSSNNDSLQQFATGGAILSETARRKFDEVLPNKNLMITYGMTEQTAIVSKPLEYRQGLSVGSMIVPNVSIKIIDEDGNALNIGETGEVCLKSMFKFIGYFNDAVATKRLMDKDDFIKTGDLGYFNDDGILFIVDRKKDILKYEGNYIKPSDIENVIESMKGVEAVSVVGIPNDLCVDLITAAIVKREGFEEITEKEVIDYAAHKLPEYKQLRGGVYFFEKFPTTLSHKIMKRSILKEILNQKKTVRRRSY